MAGILPIVLYGNTICQVLAADDLDTTITRGTVVIKINDNADPLPTCTPVFVKSNGHVDKARANAAGTVPVFGLAFEPIGSGVDSAKRVQTDGLVIATADEWDAVTGQTGGLTSGATYYLDPSAGGKLTTTVPTTVGHYVQQIGIASSATQFEIAILPSILL